MKLKVTKKLAASVTLAGLMLATFPYPPVSGEGNYPPTIDCYHPSGDKMEGLTDTTCPEGWTRAGGGSGSGSSGAAPSRKDRATATAQPTATATPPPTATTLPTATPTAVPTATATPVPTPPPAWDLGLGIAWDQTERSERWVVSNRRVCQFPAAPVYGIKEHSRGLTHLATIGCADTLRKAQAFVQGWIDRTFGIR